MSNKTLDLIHALQFKTKVAEQALGLATLDLMKLAQTINKPWLIPCKRVPEHKQRCKAGKAGLDTCALCLREGYVARVEEDLS